MPLTNLQKASLAFLPFIAEHYEQQASFAENFAWVGIARGIKLARNGLYTSVTLTVMAAMATARTSENGPSRQYFCMSMTAAGVGLTSYFSKKLYDTTLFFEKTLNSLPTHPKEK